MMKISDLLIAELA